MTLLSTPSIRATQAIATAALLVVACEDRGAPKSDVADLPSPQSPAGTPSVSPPVTPEPSRESSQETDTPTTAVLPLQPGVYVMAGTSCANPANAAFRIFDGKGLSGSTTRGCRATVTSRDGNRWQVDQSCVDTYSGERTSQPQTLTVSTDTGFTLAEAGEPAQTYRLCPAGEVPSYLRDMISPE